MARQRRRNQAAAAPSTNPIAAAYFRAADEGTTAAGDDLLRLSQHVATPSTTSREVGQVVDAIVELLAEAGLTPEQPRALLESGTSSPRLAHIRQLTAHVRETDEAAWLERNRELAFLANTVVAGCSVQSRPFTPQEASDAVLATCNLGLEQWPARWPGSETCDAASTADHVATLPDAFLAEHDLVTAFEAGWSTLHEDVCLYAARQLMVMLRELHCIDAEVQDGLRTLRLELGTQCEAGTPWRVRDALDVMATLDTAAWIALLGLLNECPVMPEALTAILEGRRGAVSATAFDFISTFDQIDAVRVFMARLPDLLGSRGHDQSRRWSTIHPAAASKLAIMVFQHFLQDLRYTARTLRRDAGFAAFAILIAGLGIGASATVFSVVNTLILRPLPFARPSELVWIANHDTSGLSGQTTQVGHMLDLRERTQTLSAIAGYFAFYGVGDNLLSGRGEPERLSGVPVSENFFDVLGVKPMLGRVFNAQESAWKGPKAVMLGYGIWERRFNRDPKIVGTSLIINDEPHTVVGVLPASFDFATIFAPGSRFDLYFSFPLSPETNRWGNTMAMIGRLKPGASAARAQAEMRTLAQQITREHPERNSFEGFVKPLSEQISGNIRLAAWVLAGAVAMVMLIVCANLSNLLLARTAARQKEVAIRMALGAGRRRLLAQMLTEGLVLSCSGAMLGLVLAVGGTRLLTRLDAVSIPLLRDVRTDGTALAFTVIVALVTGIVFGLAPALQASGSVMTSALKDASRGSTEGRGRSWVRNALVVSEIAFACVLLVGAGLLIRSLISVLDVKMGFEPARAATIRVDPDSRYSTPAQRVAYMEEVLRRVRQAPGIESAAITDTLPLGRNRTWGAGARGVTYERGKYPLAFVRVVTEGYPAAMGVPVLAGRDFAASDMPDKEPVMLVNKTMAETLWPGEDPIGKYMSGGCAKERRVVGVVGDVRHLSLEQESGNEMYIPARQCDDLAGAYLVVRSTLPPGQLATTLRAALAPVAANLAGNDFRTLQQLVDKAVSPRRFTVLLLGGFAAFALMLASLGIYALISYSVNQRTQEIGIRMALGASARDVQSHIIGQTLRLAAMGMAIGAVCSWLLVRGAASLLFGVTARDPQTFLGMVVVLTSVAILAGYLPARRASRIDPMVALRAE